MDDKEAMAAEKMDSFIDVSTVVVSIQKYSYNIEELEGTF